MIGMNATFSSEYGTVCTEDYGDCGLVFSFSHQGSTHDALSRCDNCKGSFQDISTRMDEFRDRLFVNGWERRKAVWTVPQAFGNNRFVDIDIIAYILSRSTCILFFLVYGR